MLKFKCQNQKGKIILSKMTRGFTLIETIVAIALLSAAVAGPLTMAIKSISNASVSQDQLTAFYLAQEAIEYVRKVRDDNVLSGNSGSDWLEGLDECVLVDMPLCNSGITTFDYTGTAQECKIPPGVTSVEITAYGAQGSKDGGLGGKAQATLSVKPNDVLYVYVGGQDGYNGGANGGAGGGNGGGASDVRLNGTALTDRIIIAAGGGGSGGNQSWCEGYGGKGGSGGGYSGTAGNNSLTFKAGGGEGGNTTAGGSGGKGDNGGTNGTSGTYGAGGNGGEGGYCSCASGGGGGGGGYWGGGGGGATGSYCKKSGAGGGGGSSYVPSGGTTQSGVETGNGQVIIDAGGSGGGGGKKTNKVGCYIDARDGKVDQCPETGCPVLNKVGDGYGYSGSNGTIYTRTVKIDGTLNGGNEARVNVEVKWNGRFGQKSMLLQDNIFNWR
ncbi:MAG: type II secretion system GspH family protein [Candidatus Pacebacteria bacterium]|nr:type II secretion system GspH family protein [Candidatus Paceibacterota bacterium]